jgi:hypothetical protein
MWNTFNMGGQSVKMQVALGVLGIINIPEINLEKVKKSYRIKCKEFHPDLNPNGEEMMKAINAAYERLLDCRFPIIIKEGQEIKTDFSKVLEEILVKIKHIPGIEIEVCGSWIWVSGNTKPYKDQLKEAGFKWASKKQNWFYAASPGGAKKGRGWSMGKIRDIYGSQQVEKEERTKMAA